MRYRRPRVWECCSCGRLWVAEIGEYKANNFWKMIDGSRPHVGGCIEGEPETWITACSAKVTAIEPFDTLLAAHRLSGVYSAELVTRARSARLAVPARSRHAWTWHGFHDGYGADGREGGRLL